MKGIRPIILIIGIGVMGIVLVFQVNAQATGITISPLTFELTANPGDNLTNKLKVYNPTDYIVGIKMEVEDFTPYGEVGEVRIEPAETETYSLKRWITIQPETFTLEPKEQKFIDFEISVPENAEPGGHYGSVLASTAGTIGPGATGMAIAQKVGSLVLLTVGGQMKESLIVKEFTAPGFSEYGPIPFTIRFENTGTVHVRPIGFVTITDWRGKKLADVEFPQKNVIPGAIRKVETSWNKKWLWGGKYIATLIGSYGTANTPFPPPVITFWVFPWKVGLGALLLIFLLILSRRRWLAALKILIRGK